MKNKIIDSIGKIDDDMIESVEAVRETKKKRTNPVWTRYAALAACLCLVVVGVLGGSHLGNKKFVTPEEQNQPHGVNNVPGVYVPAVELPTNTEGVVYDMLALVVYKGGIYTQAEAYYDADAERINELVGDYLGYATGSINEWSTQDDYAEEFASSCKGDVYSIKGYDTDFRVCIRQEYENENGEKSLWLQFLDRLNDITLKTGADLFESRLRISDNVAQVQWQSHDDWNNAAGNMKNADIDESLWKEFINQINLAEFIYTLDYQNTNKTIYDNQNQAHITLVMNDGTTNSLRLIEGGYVGYDPMGWYFVKIPGDTFDIVFSACGGNIQ